MNGLWERLAQHWRGGGTLEREVDDEIAFHLEMREREFMRQGWSPQEARRLARRHFGDISEVRRECLEGYVVQD
ncbi:MAG TPA: permease prefix domain 1-containing protein, partial [Candidatus Acidoferrales bacterium]